MSATYLLPIIGFQEVYEAFKFDSDVREIFESELTDVVLTEILRGLLEFHGQHIAVYPHQLDMPEAPSSSSIKLIGQEVLASLSKVVSVPHIILHIAIS